MSLGTEIILESLQEIGAHSIARSADSETIVLGMRKLNGMVRTWKSMEIETGMVPLKIPADELSEPLDARNAIVLNLAILMAPLFDNGKGNVSGQLRSNAATELNYISIFYRTFDLPEKISSATLPVGAGNSKGIQRRVFKGNNGIISDENQ